MLNDSENEECLMYNCIIFKHYYIYDYIIYYLSSNKIYTPIIQSHYYYYILALSEADAILYLK